MLRNPVEDQARVQLEIAKRLIDLDRLVGMYAQALVELEILELQQRELEETNAQA